MEMRLFSKIESKKNDECIFLKNSDQDGNRKLSVF